MNGASSHLFYRVGKCPEMSARAHRNLHADPRGSGSERSKPAAWFGGGGMLCRTNGHHSVISMRQHLAHGVLTILALHGLHTAQPLPSTPSNSCCSTSSTWSLTPPLSVPHLTTSLSALSLFLIPLTYSIIKNNMPANKETVAFDPKNMLVSPHLPSIIDQPLMHSTATLETRASYVRSSQLQWSRH